MTGELPDPGAFGAAFEDFMHAMRQAATRPQSPLAQRLREHLGADPSGLPSTVAELATTDHPNLQLALDACCPTPRSSATTPSRPTVPRPERPSARPSAR
jgi:hypothetical protein